MFLFIFESIGTAELVMIGIVALIFLGPRKLPEMARKIGKLMAEFRSTTQDFKSTWEREVNFEEEAKALDIDILERESETNDNVPVLPDNSISSPEIKEIDKEQFDKLTAGSLEGMDEAADEKADAVEPDLLSDKRNWL